MTSSNSNGTPAAQGDVEMITILEAMLEEDQTVTARAVARKHSQLGHASSITRHAGRSSLLADYQERQRQYREWRARAPKKSRDNLAAALAERDHRIAELERQVSALRVSHLPISRTVGELGGMSKLLKLYSTYSELHKELMALSALPESKLHEFPAPRSN
jgi:hypothetical protein